MTRSFALFGVSLVVLGACTIRPDLDSADYWQRAETSSALYMQGPKAQQQLHIDIATCTNEINEIRRLEKIRTSIPAEQATDGTLRDWDTPARDGYLYAEHHNYHDFETCMQAKGWQRSAYLPYTDLEKANYEYVRGNKRKEAAIRDRENVTSVHIRAQDPPPYKNLNE